MNAVQIVGWFFLLASMVVLGLGVVFIVALMRAPESELVVFSEDYQALLFRRQIEMLGHQEGLRGVAILP